MHRSCRIIAATLLLVLAGVPAARAACTPADLMAKVDLMTELVSQRMQGSLAMRRAMAARMRDAMRRQQQAGPVSYDDLCRAYDDLLDQLRR